MYVYSHNPKFVQVCVQTCNEHGLVTTSELSDESLVSLVRWVIAVSKPSMSDPGGYVTVLNQGVWLLAPFLGFGEEGMASDD